MTGLGARQPELPGVLRSREEEWLVHHLKIDLFGHLESVVDFNAEISHGTLELCMAKEQLNSPQVSGLPVNPRGLRSAH